MGFVDKNYITIHRVNNTFFDGKEVLKMYDELFELYAMELHSKLKDRINGRVFVKIDGSITAMISWTDFGWAFRQKYMQEKSWQSLRSTF